MGKESFLQAKVTSTTSGFPSRCVVDPCLAVLFTGSPFLLERIHRLQFERDLV